MLTVDATAAEIHAPGYTRRGRWFVFWTLVAAAGAGGVGPQDVHEYLPWANGRHESVGKEAWRHLQRPAAARQLVPGRWTLGWPRRTGDVAS